MSAYALLQTNKNPTDVQIKDALSGNICRCGEYIGILSAVKKAAAEARGERVTYKASLTQAEEARPSAAPAAGGVSRQFEFVTPLGTIEQFDELSLELKQRPGILGVSGSERTITLVWDPARLDEARVRQILAEAAVQGETWADGRIVLGGVAPVPYRARVVENQLKGKSIRTAIKQAAAAVRTVARPMSMNAYKVDLAQTLIERTILEALG